MSKSKDGRPDIDRLFNQMMRPPDEEIAETGGETPSVAEHSVPTPTEPQMKKGEGAARPPKRVVDTEEKKGGDTKDGVCFGRQTLNKRGKAHASYWLDPIILLAIDRRSSNEKLRGLPGEKSMIVQRALEEYLAQELNELEMLGL